MTEIKGAKAVWEEIKAREIRCEEQVLTGEARWVNYLSCSKCKGARVREVESEETFVWEEGYLTVEPSELEKTCAHDWQEIAVCGKTKFARTYEGDIKDD